jgi:hypothetical protein
MWYKHGGEATVLTGMKSRCYKTIACWLLLSLKTTIR